MAGRRFWNLGDVDDTHLEASLAKFVGAHARLEARVVAHLAEVESRRLHLLAGYSSMFDYCRRRLGLSDYEAFSRIAVARLARKYPIIFEMLDSREVHLTAICEVREFLNDGNYLALLREIAGKTKLQVREVLAEWFPRPDTEPRIRTLPVMDPLSPGRYRLELTLNATQKAKLEAACNLLSHVPGGRDFASVIERALDLLIARVRSRRFGSKQDERGGGPAQVADVAEREDASETASERKAAEWDASGSSAGDGLWPAKESVATSESETSPDPSQASSTDAVKDTGRGEGETKLAPLEDELVALPARRPRRKRKHIGNEVRRVVSERDDEQCAFVSADGQRCESKGFLQYHHRRAWALGGDETSENLVLLCWNHNFLEAEREFGPQKVMRARRKKAG